MKTLLNTLILAAFAAAGASADIEIIFDNPSQIGHPGDLLQFFGVIKNTGPDTIFLNEVNLNLSSWDLNIVPNVRDLTPAPLDQLLNSLPISLDEDKDSGDIELAYVSVSDPLADPAGLYTAYYNVFGG